MPQHIIQDIDTRPVAVIGAGTLGRRIALMMASRGAEVRLVARSAETREEGAAFANDQLPGLVKGREDARAGKVVPHEDMEAAVDGAWIVFESVPEKLDLKKQIIGDLDRLMPGDAIIASNSSSFASSQFIDRAARPQRVLNAHFLMPPQINAVELMSCGQTDPAVIDLLVQVLPRYGLDPYIVRRESTGFIFNRIWAAIKRESLRVVAEGVADPDTVDRIFSRSFGTSFGPCRMMDQVGLDVALDIEQHYADLDPNLPESPRVLLKQMIAEGRLGAKSGRGFYDDYGKAG